MNYNIDQIINEGLKQEVFPGASLLVARGNEILYEKVAGQAQIEPSRRPLTADTLFDISSLTKPIATATLFMLATQEKELDLEITASYFLPEIKASFSLRQLLNHTAGLPDWRPYYKMFSPLPATQPVPKEKLIQIIINEPLLSPPGTKVLYSDLGYLLLGVVLEKIYGEILDSLFEKKVSRPLGMKNTLFINLSPPSPQPSPTRGEGVLTIPSPLTGEGQGEGEKREFAATEDCQWRKRIICGEVMDEHAWLIGGVAGHAGLFSTAADIHRWLIELDNARRGKSAYLKKKTFDFFCHVPLNRDLKELFFTLGFDTPTKPSSSGKHFSPNSLGHLGYSGCSFWWDLEKNLVVIFLTNRVHPSRENKQIKRFRPKLHDAVMNIYG